MTTLRATWEWRPFFVHDGLPAAWAGRRPRPPPWRAAACSGTRRGKCYAGCEQDQGRDPPDKAPPEQGTQKGSRRNPSRRVHASRRSASSWRSSASYRRRRMRTRHAISRAGTTRSSSLVRRLAHTERQKLHRRIRQLARAVREGNKDKGVRARLYEARIFLHYVMVRFASNVDIPCRPAVRRPVCRGQLGPGRAERRRAGPRAPQRGRVSEQRAQGRQEGRAVG